MNRSDVFVSYRRTEKEFTHTLDRALKAEGLEVWVDWEDIPPGAPNFTKEIEIGIEGADVFVAVISKDYTESKYCMMELDGALELNKRVIPIILEKFDRSALPREVRDINWVYFYRNEDGSYPFEENFPILMEAITADREHITMHTRYLLRANEWDEKKRNGSFLLKGSELEEAERWLAMAGEKKPQPAGIHGEYIFASRALQRRQG
ncbi:MAG: toll/interleukin-1 receptor domain-containing protein, partial [Chloroflexota bacterium]